VMGLRGDGDTHGVHALHEFAVIGKDRAPERRRGFVGLLPVQVGYPDDPDVFELRVFLEVVVPEVPDPHHSYSNRSIHGVSIFCGSMSRCRLLETKSGR